MSPATRQLVAAAAGLVATVVLFAFIASLSRTIDSKSGSMEVRAAPQLADTLDMPALETVRKPRTVKGPCGCSYPAGANASEYVGGLNGCIAMDIPAEQRTSVPQCKYSGPIP
jgi:hypothetical protein